MQCMLKKLKGYMFQTNGLLIYNVYRSKNCKKKLWGKLQGSIENLAFSVSLPSLIELFIDNVARILFLSILKPQTP